MDNYIVFSSVTYAMKGKKHLKKQGISSEIMKTPKQYGFKGCTHCIKFHGSDPHMHAKSMRELGIKVLGVAQ